MSTTIQVVAPPMRMYSRWYWFKWRLAKPFHPASVTDAWYSQGCPEVLDTTAISRLDLLRWRIDRWLRECAR